MRQIKPLLHYLRPYWLPVGVSVILLALVGLLQAFRLLLIGPVFQRVLNPSISKQDIDLFRVPGTHYIFHLQNVVPDSFHNDWTVVAFALVVSTILKGICDYCGTYLVNYGGFGMVTDLRNDVYNAVLRRSAAFFQRHATGSLISTIVNDIERVQFAMSSVLAEMMQQFFTFFFTAAVVIIYGRKLSWILLIFVPVIIGSSRKVGRSVRTTTRKGQDRLAEIQNILHETITGVRIVKAFGMELWEILRFRSAAKRLFRANLRSVSAAAVSSPLMDVLGSIAIALLLLVGRQEIKTGYMDLPHFMTFIAAVFSLYDPVRKFAGFYNNFQQAIGASSGIVDFMQSEDEVREKAGAREMKPFAGAIRFDHVSFAYESENPEDRREILHDIDFDVHRGEVLAIVGSSGSGKTTLVHLLPRFFDVSTGAVLIDGQDIRDATVASLRKQIGIVTQETILFNDTVRNNIAYGQPHVSQEQVEAASQAALAHDFIMNLPEGYNTIIGERGVRLSGGERQRLAIARAILKNAPILILDEATSALDTESESLVASALQNLMAGRTVFVIAHRLSTVRRADRIMVIEKGTIVDSGSHDELMSHLGTYRKLYDLQFVDIDGSNGETNGNGVRVAQSTRQP
ncbi:MAG TPA: ABC transporter ATP-binding protein [Candidatus Koribacter sp.]|jgi:subfamily B ATP-binding cassette protein MsbA